MTLRLLAGALDLPAIPTRSLVGTDLAEGPNRALVDNPFGDEQMQMLAPLRPDVAFLHAPIADTDGNVRVEGPFGEDLWGAWASARVVVTAEKVVTPAELASLGPGPGLPADRVDAVVEAPFGAHPQGQYVWSDRLSVVGYAEDYAFRAALRAANRDPANMNAWLDEWVFGMDHAAYLKRLGEPRLKRLRHEATDDFMPSATHALPHHQSAPPSPQECAAVVAMRRIHEHLQDAGSSTLVAGIGLSHLAAWAASRELPDAQLVAETGMSGMSPVPGDPYLFNYPNSHSAAVHDGFLRMLGAVGTRGDRAALAVLAAGQVDRTGTVNSSVSDGEFIVGSGGANDLANSDATVLLVMPLSRSRTPDHVEFATTRPRHLLGLASDVGLLEPIDGELVLTRVLESPGGVSAAIDHARARCGWDLRVSHTLTTMAAPRLEELEILRGFDPARELLG
jgi:acyl CoA:acetate/3-ketoacid CoA transferase beta subunit